MTPGVFLSLQWVSGYKTLNHSSLATSPVGLFESTGPAVPDSLLEYSGGGSGC